MSELDTNLNETAGGQFTFRLGGRRFAMGLEWLTAETPDAVDKEARHQAKDRKSNLYLVRSLDTGAQYGLGRKSDGLQSGSVSAAAVLAETFSEELAGEAGKSEEGERRVHSVCALFALESGGYWFFAQRGDFITPTGDRYFETEADARRFFQDAVDEGDWTRIYSPEGMGGEARPLKPILELAKRPKIKTVNQLTGVLLPVLLVMILAGGAYFGVTTYLENKAQEERDAAIAATQAALAAQAAADAAAAQQVEPWPEFAIPSDAIAECDRGRHLIMPSTPGWAMTAWTCDVAKTSANFNWEWTRLFGTTAWLQNWLAQTYSPSFASQTSFDIDGDHAGTSLSGEAVKARGKQAALHDEQRITVDFFALAQQSGAALHLGGLQLPQPPEGTKAEDWTPPPYGWMNWSLDVISLGGWNTALDAFPGLVVKQISYDPNTNGFVLKGDIYVQR